MSAPTESETDRSKPSGYPDSHLSRSMGSGTRSTRILFGLIPLVALAAWFGYMWYVSGVLPSKEKYPSGKLKAEGYVKRTHLGEYVRHGHWTTYHESGEKLGEGTYNMGHKEPDWKYWDESGKPVAPPPDNVADAPVVTSNSQ